MERATNDAGLAVPRVEPGRVRIALGELAEDPGNIPVDRKLGRAARRMAELTKARVVPESVLGHHAQYAHKVAQRAYEASAEAPAWAKCLEETVAGLAAKVEAIDGAVGAVAARVEAIDEKLDAAVARVEGKVDAVAARTDARMDAMEHTLRSVKLQAEATHKCLQSVAALAARAENARVLSVSQPLALVPAAGGSDPPPSAPRTIAELNAMKGEKLNELMVFYEVECSQAAKGALKRTSIGLALGVREEVLRVVIV
jgi:hypothetical protein